MSEPELEPLDPELRSLFAAEARIPEVPAALRARVAEKLSLATPAVVPVPPARGAVKLALVFALGAGTGAGVHALLAPEPAPRIVEVVKPAPEPVPIVIPLPPPLPVETSEPPRERKRASPRTEPEKAPPVSIPAGDLARERAVLDAARTAIARGHADDALAALGRHAAEFPGGSLVEEREGLWVLALVRAGQLDAARARADAFRTRYPTSLMGPAIDRAVSAAP